MRFNQLPEQPEILDLVRAGITPRALEQAHRTHTVRVLGKQHGGVTQHELKSLAERWGIGYDK